MHWLQLEDTHISCLVLGNTCALGLDTSAFTAKTNLNVTYQTL
jgi:hypothetical protein